MLQERPERRERRERRAKRERRERRERPERPERRKWCHKRCLRPNLPRTPGAMMTVVTQTLSNEGYAAMLHMIYYQDVAIPCM